MAAAPGTPAAAIPDGDAVVGVQGAAASASAPRGWMGASPPAGRPAAAVGSNAQRASSAAPRHQPRPRPEAAAEGEEAVAGQKSGCTLAQMRRFIKSRPYVPVHELRRRFLIEGIEDEVSPMATGQGTLFVGLPEREASFLGELVKAGEVGCELLLDPTSPAVVGVFPMRPVTRQ